jgi:ATP-dependent helicase HrpA
VQNGVCIRLYSEEEYQERPAFTQPELQRANLAEVILRMKAFHLGEIETFPFLDPPRPQAILGGYVLLQELGALDEGKNLTALGKDLARLPLDPTIGRMILESEREGVVEEVSIIAAGLSIQDPRERPADQKEAADQAQKTFSDSESDFLSLLNLWDAFHDKWENLKTQNQLRKFCRSHFLSYSRMREWRDIYHQIRETLGEIPGRSRPGKGQGTTGSKEAGVKENRKGPGWRDAVHRAILSGLLGQVARKTERNVYRASGNREVMLFPGSGLFDKAGKKFGKQGKDGREEKRTEARQPEWIMAGEIVETSRLYARTAAKIHPDWIVRLGPHLCRSTFQEPVWNEKAGRVLVRERIAIYGMEVGTRKVDYGGVNPKEATEIFIRSALIEEGVNYRFLEKNREVRQKIEMWRTRMRRHDLPNVEAALFSFYEKRIENVSSIHDLNRLIAEKKGEEFLWVTEQDLVGGRDLNFDTAAFPEKARLGSEVLPLAYAYAPGEERDGVTVKVAAHLARDVDGGALHWVVPGLREELALSLLRGLPKALRKELMPLAERAKEIAAAWEPGEGSFTESLGRFIRKQYGVAIPEAEWKWDAVPDYARPRFEITGKEEKVLASGRDFEVLKRNLRSQETKVETAAWDQVAARWERYGLREWNLGDLPERIEVAQVAGIPMYGYPGLKVEEGEVCLRLFRTKAEVDSRLGMQRLAELAVGRELAWLEKDLRGLEHFKALYVTLGPVEELKRTAWIHLRWHLFQCEKAVSLTKARFEGLVEQARARLPGLTDRFMRMTGQVLEIRQQILLLKRPHPSLAADLNRLLPPNFLELISHERLQHVPRYLKAMQVRAERHGVNPLKDQERARLVQPFQERLEKLRAAAREKKIGWEVAAEFRWMLEEFKVSVFAQELGTPQPISGRRLERFLAEKAG